MSPASFRHYGIAYGAGVAGNLRRKPYLAAALPLMLTGFARAARRASAGADLVHAHWLPAGLVAMATRKPFVVQVWGTDVELARRAPALARRVLQRARLVIAPSSALADEALRLGATDVRTIPSGVDLPVEVRDPADPPEILYAGRLSPEKGVRELVAAANGMPLVVVGDGPLRGEVPGALGFLPHEELERRFERAAVVACPSHREGFGVVLRGGHGVRAARRRRRRGRTARPGRARGDRPARSTRRRGCVAGRARDACSRTPICDAATAKRGGRGSPSASPGSASRTKPCGPTTTRSTRLEGPCSR